MDLAERLSRYRRFYAGDPTARLLIVISHGGGEPGESVGLGDYDFTSMAEHRRYWDALVHQQLAAIRSHEGIADDWIPGVEVYYGYGAFGAVFGDGVLRFAGDTSFIDPALTDWADLGALDLSAPRFWSDVFVEASRALSRQAAGRFLVNAFPAPTPLDVANLLRGNDVFLDVHTEPVRLKQLLATAAEALIAYLGRLREATANPGGGQLAFNRWIPRGAVIVEDAADLCSPEVYREFAAPFTQRVIQAVGGAYLHHHSLGRHQYANIAALEGLYVQQISSDPNCRRPITELADILAQVGDLPIDLECTAEEVYEHAAELKHGRAILSVELDERSEASDLVAFVRGFSAGE